VDGPLAMRQVGEYLLDRQRPLLLAQISGPIALEFRGRAVVQATPSAHDVHGAKSQPPKLSALGPPRQRVGRLLGQGL